MKNLFQRSSTTALLIAALLIAGGVTVQAQEETGTSTIERLQTQIQQLQEQVAELRERIRAQRSGSESTSTADADESDTDGDDLEIGDRGERVRQLQQLLAQDRSIYPEGLATGYYGNLTAQAVARLQQRIGIPDDGEFNDNTMRRIRNLITNGAGDSGITPPGLLKAPGIARLLGGDNDDSDADDDDNDSDEVESDDRRRGPDIDNMSIPDELKERLRAIFNRFDDDDSDEDDDDDDELEIEAEVEDGETEVEVEYPDGTEEEFTFDTTDRDEVIARLVEETDLTEEEIEAVLEFEDEDDDDEDDDSDDDDEDDDDDDDED